MAHLELNTPEKLKIEYDIFGTGRTILFLHGGGTDYHSYLKLINTIAKNYKVICFSVPGFGTSSNMKKYKLEHFSLMIDQLLQYLGIKQFYIMGHSMGGGLALYLASLPEFKDKLCGVMTISPLVDRISKRFIRIFRDLRKQHKLEPIIPGKRSKRSIRWILMNPRKWKSVFAEYKLLRFLQKLSFSDMFNNIEIPVISFISEKDLVLDPKMQIERLSKIKNIKIIKWENSGHNALHHRTDEIIEELNLIY